MCRQRIWPARCADVYWLEIGRSDDDRRWAYCRALDDAGLVYYGHFLCIVSLRWYVFCILVVLVKLSVLAKWLARKIPLKNPHGQEIDSTKPRQKIVYDFLGLVYCFTVLWCVYLVLRLIRDIFHTSMAVCADSAVKHQSTLLTAQHIDLSMVSNYTAWW